MVVVTHTNILSAMGLYGSIFVEVSCQNDGSLGPSNCTTPELDNDQNNFVHGQEDSFQGQSLGECLNLEVNGNCDVKVSLIISLLT